MAIKCVECRGDIEAYRKHTNFCEKCAEKVIKELTEDQLKERYTWF